MYFSRMSTPVFNLKDYLSKWTWMRIVQLIVGVVFLGNYFDEGGFFNLAFGGMMFLQALLNMGCFSSKGCSTPSYNTDSNPTDSTEKEVEFEEIV